MYNNHPSIGASTPHDWDNGGWQMTRTTYENGIHNHDLSGQSHTSHSSITKTGNNEKHENRQPFYVVAYIIFLGLM
jgi:microcystin-dependent protein